MLLNSNTKDEFPSGTKFVIGSHMYGTATESSDKDVIEIVNEYPNGQSKKDDGETDTQYFTPEDFLRALDRHDVLILEALYLNDSVPDWFELDLGKLRTAFSTVANGAWVKAKKKLTVASDYDKEQGLKSAFHAMRILDYGIQLAANGRIDQPRKDEWILADLIRMGRDDERDRLWDKVESKYTALFKTRRHDFKTLAPKSNTIRTKQKDKLIQILQAHRIKPTRPLVKDIMEALEI